jgi:RNA polymerase sigma factor (sigma-70 family)
MSERSGVPEQNDLKDLLARVALGDRDAFAKLYQRTSPRLLSVCARMLADRREAEEVLQETYVSVWQRSKTFDPARASAVPWLVALARNKAIDRLRQHHDSAAVNVEMEEIADENPSPAAHAEYSQEYRLLERCMEQLEPRQRGSIQGAFFSGLTYNALAEHAKVPLGTMKSWIRRGLLQLRACLET